MNRHSTWVQRLLGFCIGLYASVPAFAAPGDISPTPLIVAQSAPPNIMMLLDSSGSMGAFVPESPYDETNIYATCPASERFAAAPATAERIYYYNLGVINDGRVFMWRYELEELESGDFIVFSIDGFDWGTTTGNGHVGFDMGCFDPATEYNATLHANNAQTWGFYADFGSTRGLSTYTGNFLNWYFTNGTGSPSANFGAGAQEKANMITRMKVAQTAANALVDSLSNVNIGLVQFNGDDGGRLLQEISDIDSGTHKADVKASINAIVEGGNTPLAETFETIGRYFIEGTQTQNLTLHPKGTPVSKQGQDIFSMEPDYNGITKPTNAATAVLDSQKFCEKNFIVGLTDGLPTEDDGVDGDLVTYDSDGDSFALNDVAKALYEMDLRPDIDDLNGDEHLNNIFTYMIGFADETLQDDPLLGSTAANGGGASYVADDAAQLADAFNQISSEIAGKTASVASVAFNSSTLNSESAVFQARFDATNWSGSLIALPLDLNGNLPADADSDGFPDPAWDAATKLDAFTASQLNNRVIMTHDGSDGVVFAYSSNTAAPTALHASDLGMDSSDNAADNEVEARFNYIRGDQSNEGTSGNGYRSRLSILGDIVNSTPVYVGESEIRWPDSFGATGNRHFVNYVEALPTDTEDGIKGRTPVLYVGANDGMLHGFNASIGTADSGKEVFAYIPRKVLSSAQNEGLHYYADDSYIHKFYVDLTPAISDAYIKNATTGSKDWRTVLIGGLRAGGAGYFALDVSNPDDFANTAAAASSTVLWEFTDSDDADLGYAFSRPVIAKMNNGKWAAIFGNGYNSAAGLAKLFIVFLEEGLDGTWTSGTDYIEIDTEVGTSGDKNGLSSPAVLDLDFDGMADRVYAGDLKGNLWAFDVSDSNTTKWEVAYKDGNGAGAAPEPLFTAEDSGGLAQPIMAAPMPILNKENVESGGAPNLLITFGTGQYVANADLTSLDRQSFYAVWDDGEVDSTKSALDRSDLAVRTLLAQNVTQPDGSTKTLRTISGDSVDWTSDFGWYMDLLPGVSGQDGAERVVSSPQLRRRVLFFNSIVPDSRPCSGGGTGWLMSLNYATGLAVGQLGDDDPGTTTYTNNDATFDADGDGDIDADDAGYVGEQVLGGIPSKSGILGDKQYTPTSDGSLDDREVNVGTGVGEGRLGWQELTPGG